ncbi:hypothetical protein ECLT68_3669 [Escherichia coli LT-68]|nr:hypothetical protein ECLT68_3669 [Escherichia coli LT-68]
MTDQKGEKSSWTPQDRLHAQIPVMTEQNAVTRITWLI